MDLKKESRIFISLLALAPTAVGILIITNGEGVLYGLLLAVIGLAIILGLGQPWKWFQKNDKAKK